MMAVKGEKGVGCGCWKGGSEEDENEHEDHHGKEDHGECEEKV
jgi:hypothetical protein